MVEKNGLVGQPTAPAKPANSPCQGRSDADRRDSTLRRSVTGVTVADAGYVVRHPRHYGARASLPNQSAASDEQQAERGSGVQHAELPAAGLRASMMADAT